MNAKEKKNKNNESSVQRKKGAVRVGPVPKQETLLLARGREAQMLSSAHPPNIKMISNLSKYPKEKRGKEEYPASLGDDFHEVQGNKGSTRSLQKLFKPSSFPLWCGVYGVV
eukprot:Hpha_TRINITY_DN15864_c3_g2::TRINITY_DN15864_c3_g2_i1::g.192070::m.192070